MAFYYEPFDLCNARARAWFVLQVESQNHSQSGLVSAKAVSLSWVLLIIFIDNISRDSQAID